MNRIIFAFLLSFCSTTMAQVPFILIRRAELQSSKIPSFLSTTSRKRMFGILRRWNMKLTPPYLLSLTLCVVATFSCCECCAQTQSIYRIDLEARNVHVSGSSPLRIIARLVKPVSLGSMEGALNHFRVQEVLSASNRRSLNQLLSKISEELHPRAMEKMSVEERNLVKISHSRLMADWIDKNLDPKSIAKINHVRFELVISQFGFFAFEDAEVCRIAGINDHEKLIETIREKRQKLVADCARLYAAEQWELLAGGLPRSTLIKCQELLFKD